MPQLPGIVATMSDNKSVNIFNIAATYQSLLARGPLTPAPTRPCYIYKGHTDEGFALDWSPVVSGQLATGDCAGVIRIWKTVDNATWSIDNTAFLGHKKSVEDIQWSPTETTVFASASADKTIRIWDTRGKGVPQITVDDAHTDDVNVISWNRNIANLFASASDDGSFKV